MFYYMREDNYMVKDTQLPLDQFSGFLRIKHVSMEHLSFTSAKYSGFHSILFKNKTSYAVNDPIKSTVK